MFRSHRLALLLLTLALPLAACSDGEMTGASSVTPPATDANADDEAAEDTPAVQVVDGVQVAEIEVGRMGYAPRTVTLEAGVPARLVFTRTIESACAEQIQAPDFAVPVTDLPLNEPVAIEFTPGEGGSFTYMCGMDMMRGTVVVQA